MTITHTDAKNSLYKPILTIHIGEHDFEIFGSMSWTVSKTKELPWEKIRSAYVSLTGDTREQVGHEAAAYVVAGELQNQWARHVGRVDILPTIEHNQERRVALALQSVEDPRPARAGRAKKEPSQGGGRNMSESNTDQSGAETQSGAATATAEKPAKEKGKRGIPTRGSMGAAAKLITEGERDLDTIVKSVSAGNPNVKNVERHTRYVARVMGVTLTKAGKEVKEPAGETAASA